MIKRLRKHYLFLWLLLVLAAFVVAIFVPSSRFWSKNKTTTETSDVSGFVYQNALYDIQFQVSEEYTVEDVSFPDRILVYPSKDGLLNTNLAENDFIQKGGMFIKSMREIPGTREVFEIFQKNDFEKNLKELGYEYTSEKFVTKNGYDAFKINITKPVAMQYITVDSPIAFWFAGPADGKALDAVVNTFKPSKSEESASLKEVVVISEETARLLREKDYGKVYSQLSSNLGSKQTLGQFTQQISPFQERLNRTLTVVSVKQNSKESYIRGVLEDKSKVLFSFYGLKLIKENDKWRIDSIVIDKDRDGVPSTQIQQRKKSQVNIKDLMKNK